MQAVEKYGADNLSEKTAKLAQDKPHDKVLFVHAIEPREVSVVGARMAKNLVATSPLFHDLEYSEDRAQLAELVGASRQTVSLAVGRLTGQGALTPRRGAVEVRVRALETALAGMAAG